MTRVLKRPDLRKNRTEISEDIFRNPKELEALKEQIRPEDYLKLLYNKIFLTEKQLETVSSSAEETKSTIHRTVEQVRAVAHKELSAIESALILKREERASLEKPLFERQKLQDERERKLDERTSLLDSENQRIFEKERVAESKLDGLQDLADSLGETRVRLTVKEKGLDKRESVISQKEMGLLVAIEEQKRRESSWEESAKERDYSLSLREMNIIGKEENLIVREKQLVDGNRALNDKYETLLRTEKRLYGRRSK